jgi:hypothetical protein
MGEARRRQLAGGPKIRPKASVRPENPPTAPPRSPEEVEEDERRDDRNYAYIAAAIDFIHNIEERNLRSKFQVRGQNGGRS